MRFQILRHIAIAVILVISTLAQAKFEFITDLEGRIEQLDALVKDGILIRKSDGSLDFKGPDFKIVFGGDLMDRGPHSIKLMRILIGLKMKYPNRVALVWGNRDMNKLSFAYNRESLMSNIQDDNYREFLTKKLNELDEAGRHAASIEKLNTNENQIQWWAEKYGLTNVLKFHQDELSELRKAKVSYKDACLDFVDMITNPAREYLTYIRLGQLVHIDGPTVVVHGGLPSQVGFMPDSSKVYENVDEWGADLNKWGQEKANLIIQGIVRGNMPPQGLKLIFYSDALFDSNLKIVWNHDNSTIYGQRYKEDGNFRLPSQNTTDWLKASGKTLLLLGHSPAGNVPTPLRGDKVMVIMGDTSFGPNGAFSRVTVNGDTVSVRGRLTNGTAISYQMNPLELSPIGMLYGKETVIGQTQDGRHVLFQYQGYTINERLVPQNELKLSELKIPTYDINFEFESQKSTLMQAMEERKTKHIDLDIFGQDFLVGKNVVFLAGSSAYADPQEEAKAKVMLERLLTSVDPKTTILITGGTDKGPEKIAHEIASRRGIYIHSLLVSAALPQEVSPYVKSYSWVGHDWAEQPKAGMDFISKFKGLGVILGGGGLLQKALEYGRSINAKFLVASTIRHGNGNVSASMNMAQVMPDVSFSDVKELLTQVERLEPKLIQTIASVTAPVKSSLVAMPSTSSSAQALVPSNSNLEISNGGNISARQGFQAILNMLKNQLGNPNGNNVQSKIVIISSTSDHGPNFEIKAASTLLLYLYSLSSQPNSIFTEALTKISKNIFIGDQSLTPENLKSAVSNLYRSSKSNLVLSAFSKYKDAFVASGKTAAQSAVGSYDPLVAGAAESFYESISQLQNDLVKAGQGATDPLGQLIQRHLAQRAAARDSLKVNQSGRIERTDVDPQIRRALEAATKR